MLRYEGVRYFLSEKLSQDPLEEYFQKQRARGGCNENPGLPSVGGNFVALTVYTSDLVKSTRGNTRGTTRVDTSHFNAEDTCSLPKRKKKEKQ